MRWEVITAVAALCISLRVAAPLLHGRRAGRGAADDAIVPLLVWVLLAAAGVAAGLRQLV